MSQQTLQISQNGSSFCCVTVHVLKHDCGNMMDIIILRTHRKFENKKKRNKNKKKETKIRKTKQK